MEGSELLITKLEQTEIKKSYFGLVFSRTNVPFTLEKIR